MLPSDHNIHNHRDFLGEATIRFITIEAGKLSRELCNFTKCVDYLVCLHFLSTASIHGGLIRYEVLLQFSCICLGLLCDFATIFGERVMGY